jgi:hypothetical protein
VRLTAGLAVLGFAAALTGCATAPGGPALRAACQADLDAYARHRPDALTADEWAERSWSRDPHARGQPDYRFTKAEWLAPATPPPGTPYPEQWAKGRRSLERTFDRMDKGHKGYLVRADFLPSYKQEFQLLDRNRDGWVTLNECAVTFPDPFS